MRTRGALLIALLMVQPSLGHAADESSCTAARLMFVLDKSSSMTRMLGSVTYWDVAADALGQVARSYQDRVELGLNVFPRAGQCTAGSVVVPPARMAADAIVGALVDPPPDAGNYTPMAQTLDAVRSEPSMTETTVRPHVVLITDGWQWCDPYDPSTRYLPVDSVRRLTQAGIKTFVVGFGDGVDASALNQMAVAAGTDRPGCDPAGEAPDAADPCYYQADDPSELLAALMDVAGQVSQDEQCNGIDDDCDGMIDEDLTMACGDGCSIQTCEAGSWGACISECGPGEICEAGQCIDDSDPPADDPPADDPYGVSGGGCQASGRGPASGALVLLAAIAALALARRRRLASAIVATVLGAGTAAAQTFSVERFVPSTDRDGVVDVEWAEVPKHLDYDVAFWFGAANDPLIAYREMDGQHMRIGSLVSQRIGADVVGSLALWDWAQIGVDVPLIVSQDQDPGLTMTTTATKYKIGDVRLAPKVQLYAEDGMALAIIGNVTLPTAAEGQYLGEGSAVFSPELAFSKRMDGFRLAANAGYRVRKHTEVVNLVVDDEIFGRIGGALRVAENIELASSLSLATSAKDPISAANANYVELLGGVSIGLGKTIAAFAGGGVGLQEGFGAPDWRLLAGLRWYHRTPDEPARVAPPPREPEPEPEPEIVEEEPVQDEEPLAVLKEDRIEILERVHFKVDKAVILEESYPILDSVARIINRHPEIKVLRVEGHTDSTASDLYNDHLSQRRAESVRDYLSNRGVDATRLEAVGFGETRPIATNDTAEGRAANRRVQFIIAERAGEAAEGASVQTDEDGDGDAGDQDAATEKSKKKGDDDDDGSDEDDEE